MNFKFVELWLQRHDLLLQGGRLQIDINRLCRSLRYGLADTINITLAISCILCIMSKAEVSASYAGEVKVICLCRDEDDVPFPQQTAADRFKRAAAILKDRDVADRKEYKERKRRKLAELKAKKRAREGGDDGGTTVSLGPGLGDPFSQGTKISALPCTWKNQSSLHRFLCKEGLAMSTASIRTYLLGQGGGGQSCRPSYIIFVSSI